MRDSVIARRYARAIYKLSYARGVVEEVLAELAAFSASFDADADLRRVLMHPGIPEAGKRDVVAKIVADETTRDSLRFLMERERLELVPAVFAEFQKEYRRDEGILAARVTSAVPLPEDLKKRLAAALERLTGKRVEIEAVLDESVIGGMSLRIGDHVIDATLATRLREMRDAMAGAA